jgi:hypothetical protein
MPISIYWLISKPWEKTIVAAMRGCAYHQKSYTESNVDGGGKYVTDDEHRQLPSNPVEKTHKTYSFAYCL